MRIYDFSLNSLMIKRFNGFSYGYCSRRRATTSSRTKELDSFDILRTAPFNYYPHRFFTIFLVFVGNPLRKYLKTATLLIHPYPVVGEGEGLHCPHSMYHVTLCFL